MLHPWVLLSCTQGGQKAARGELCRIIRDLGSGIIRNECGYAFLALLCGEQRGRIRRVKDWIRDAPQPLP
jgi:hypothetical protein